MRHFFLLLAASLLFAACNSTPDHARYIPADATATVGVNLKALGKKIAWSKIVGSDLLDELEKKAKNGDAAVRDLEKAGIQTVSTVYIYVKNSAAAGNRGVAILPLKSADDWSAYVKKTFPSANPRTTGERTEARLSDGLYAGWNKEVLMVMNTQDASFDPYDADAINDSTFSTPMTDEVADGGYLDDVRLTAEMQQAFAVKKDASILTDKRFKKLEGEGHDVSVFLNYDQLMNNMGSGADMGMMTAMYANLYKGTAATAGFDFEKGKVTGEALYYASESMKDAYKDLSNDKVDPALIDRVPGQGLNGLFAWNLSPKGLKSMLEKMNLLGMVNMGLSSQGFSLEDITEAFAGDMVMAVNNLKVNTVADTAGYGMVELGDTYTRKQPQMDYLFAMKIGKREKFDKIIAWGAREQVMTAAGTNMWMLGPASSAGSPVLLVDKAIAVVARDAAQARAYLDNKAGGKLPETARDAVTGHPVGIYMDVQTALGTMGATAFDTPKDAAIAAEVKRVFGAFTMHSTGFRGDAFHYEMALNLMNGAENSLVQLIDFASRVRAINQQYPDANEAPAIAAPGMMDSDTSALVEPATEDAQ